MSASPSGSYPIRLQIDYQEQHSRLTTFFRFLLVIPHQIILSVLGIVMSVLVSVAWIVILITGRHPQGIHSTISQILRWEGILIDPVGAIGAVMVYEFVAFGLAQGTISHTRKSARSEAERGWKVLGN